MSAVSRAMAAITAFCVARAWLVVAATLAIALATTLFVASHMAISTDTQTLFSPNLPFRQDETRFEAAFPNADSAIVAVIDAPSSDEAALASRRLVTALQNRPDLFRRVRDEQDRAFFRQNGLLFLSRSEVADATQSMMQAAPLLAPIAQDPSLRGALSGLSASLDAVAAGYATFDDLAPQIRGLREAMAPAAEGRTVFYNWRAALAGEPEAPSAGRRLVLIDPQLDYARLQPGRAATDAVRAIALEQSLDSAHGIRLRLTGSAPLADEEFGTLSEHIGLIGGLMLAAIVVMLWLATHSVRVLLCILASTFVGLSAAAALGLAMFGQFNVISVAFIPLFVGLGIDFGIQYAVRFRAEQDATRSPDAALTRAAEGIGVSLALAAAAISAGFLTFLPTRYAGVSQLGAIAGLGLLLAVGLAVTFLPALLKLTNPPAPKGALASTVSFQKIDTFVLKHRKGVLIVGALAGAACLALMPLLRFDFNPTHLRSVRTESVSTLLSLYADPAQSVSVVNVLAPSLADAQPIAARLAAAPEVASVTALDTFIPNDQDEKLPLIEETSRRLDAALNPTALAPAPNDQAIVLALGQAADKLRLAVGAHPASAAAADASALADVLTRLADGAPDLRVHAAESVLPGLLLQLDNVRTSLRAQRVTRETLPDDLVREWIAADGRARLVVAPKGDQNDNDVLRNFATAVRAVAPNATGAPISIQEAGRAIVEAFLIAGALSFLAVTLILFVALRRPVDVAITMTPIVLTGLLTLGCAAALNEPLNFANVIALPLLIGIGVAFHIYFVMAWRSGEGHLLQSSLARGVLFSALTTATGFGALWLSSHPGTASMGRLLMISLLWTLVSALLFQPALMGPAPKPKA